MSLFRRPSGYFGWEARDQRLPNGRIALSLRTKDRAESKRRARALDLLLERGEFEVLARIRSGDLHIANVSDAVRDGAFQELRRVSGVDLSLGAMVERVMSTKEATRGAGTQHTYGVVTRHMLAKWGRDRNISDISVDEIRAWFYAPRGPRRRPWAPNTQRSVAMVAGYLWRQAIELEADDAERTGGKPRITRNPWDRIEVNEQAQPRKAFLEPAEWNDLLESCRGRPEAAFVAIGCLAGLRIGEVLALRTDLDVDLDAGLIRVQAREGDYEWRPKHAHSEREVPMVPSLRAVIEEHIATGFAGDRYFIRTAGQDRPMTHTTGQLWTRQAFSRVGIRYGREGDALTFHSLRHTFASWLVREGWSASLVAKLMGNTAAEVDRTYAHLYPKDLTKVVLTLERLVEQK